MQWVLRYVTSGGLSWTQALKGRQRPWSAPLALPTHSWPESGSPATKLGEQVGGRAQDIPEA